jgi:hypothetical protein
MVTRARRGQAMVEAVLGLLVFLTVLMFGIYFAEVGFLSVKVQEAASAPLWDATARRMHLLPSDFNQSRSSADTARDLARDRYADFDGRSSTPGARTVTSVYASVSDLELNCDNSYDLGFRAQGAATSLYNGTAAQSGIACRATAKIGSGAMQIPTAFVQNDNAGFFDAIHFARAPFEICGVGPIAPPCGNSRLGLMLDDWALHDGQESAESPLNSTGTPYYQSTKKIYSATSAAAGRAGMQLLTRLQLTIYVDEDRYWLNYRGIESDFKGSVPSGEGPSTWVTSPGNTDGIAKEAALPQYKQVKGLRQQCFPGSNCAGGP